MTTQTKELIFTAWRLKPAANASAPHLIQRARVSNALAQYPSTVNTVIVEAPAGAGKSTAILQSVLRLGWDAEYIGARHVPAELVPSIAGEEVEPTSRTSVIANILTQLAKSPTQRQVGINELLEQFDSLQCTTAPILIIDDLDLLPPAWFTEIRDYMPGFLDDHRRTALYLVTRRISNETRTWLMGRGKIAFLPVDSLQIGADELEELITTRVWSTALEIDIHATYDDVGGWIGGLNKSLTAGSLDTYVLDEIVLNQDPRMQQVTYVIGMLPYTSGEMIADILETEGVTRECARDMFFQLPIWQGASHHQRVDLPPALSDSLARLAHLYGDLETVHELCHRAMNWYVKHGDYAAAKELALTSDLTNDYLGSVHSQCAALATRDKWQDIAEIITGIPVQALTGFSDLAFWLAHGLAYDNRWAELEALRIHVLTPMIASDDPLTRGRGLLVQTWFQWGAYQDEESHASAVASYRALPAESIQERMFAAVAAENTARHLGNQTRITKWEASSTSCYAAFSMGSDWWLLNAVYGRMNHIALRGDLTLAKENVDLALSLVDGSSPRPRCQLLILLAHIEIEKANFAEARVILDHAARLVDGPVPKTWLDLANAYLALIGQKPNLAKSLLEVDGVHGVNRTDRNSRRMRLLALAEIQCGNLDLATDIIAYWAGGTNVWPHAFGESHPQLLSAHIAILLNNIADAEAIARSVAAEAERRGHHAITIAALAFLAECHHRNADVDAREQVISRIKHLDPNRLFKQSCAPLGNDVLRLADQGAVPKREIPEHTQQMFDSLSARELELINAAAAGMSNTQISELFQLSRSTVKNHMASVYKKLGVHNRTEAIAITSSLR